MNKQEAAQLLVSKGYEPGQVERAFRHARSFDGPSEAEQTLLIYCALCGHQEWRHNRIPNDACAESGCACERFTRPVAAALR